MMNLADEIKRLHELRQAGALTESEFILAKEKLLAVDAQMTGQSDQDPIRQLNTFRRSKNDRWIGGVCGGLAKISGLQSWIWRLLFFVFTCYFGAGFWIYILIWLFVPEEA